MKIAQSTSQGLAHSRNTVNAAIITTAVVSLATGFMRGAGCSVIRTPAACMAPWQVEGWWGHQSLIFVEGHSVSHISVGTLVTTA